MVIDSLLGLTEYIAILSLLKKSRKDIVVGCHFVRKLFFYEITVH